LVIRKNNKGGQGNVYYPWEDWFKKDKKKLKKGRDYNCLTSSMSQLARRHAVRLGYEIKVRQDDLGMEIQVVTRPKSRGRK